MAGEHAHFLNPELLKSVTGKKIDNDVIRHIQGFTDKIMADILSRASLLTRHVGSDVIDVNEIAMIVEKDFDYSFGMRVLIPERELPAPEHIERMAELSKQK